MNEIVILLGLVLAVWVVQAVVTDVLPVRVPAALGRTVTVLFGIGLAWGLDYSVFTAFGQSLRLEWMHPVMTGVVLVAFGEFVTTVVKAIAHRAGEPPVDAAPAPGHIRAA